MVELTKREQLQKLIQEAQAEEASTMVELHTYLTEGAGAPFIEYLKNCQKMTLPGSPYDKTLEGILANINAFSQYISLTKAPVTAAPLVNTEASAS